MDLLVVVVLAAFEARSRQLVAVVHLKPQLPFVKNLIIKL
jgi:hypothetical protein